MDPACTINRCRRFDYKRSRRYAGSSMTRPLAQLNRFFVSPDFSIYYRRAKQLLWENQATSGYSLLATLSGHVDYNVDRKPASLAASNSVVREPNINVTAKGRQVELLFLTFS